MQEDWTYEKYCSTVFGGRAAEAAAAEFDAIHVSAEALDDWLESAEAEAAGDDIPEEWAEFRDRARAEIIMSVLPTIGKAAHESRSLEELCNRLNQLDALITELNQEEHLDDYVNVSGLPTFGPQPEGSLDNVWSYDQGRVLRVASGYIAAPSSVEHGDGSNWYLESREDLG